MTTVVPEASAAYIDITETDGTSSTIEVVRSQAVELITAGPQGPPGITIPVVSNSPTSGSVIYYDDSVATFRVDSQHTFITITDGGNF